MEDFDFAGLDYWQLLARWQELQTILPRLQEEERALRQGLFNGTFPDPTEGVNKYPLPDGRILKGTYKLNYKVDQKGAVALSPALQKLVLKTKYDLVLKPYRALNEAQKKKVDAILTVTPGLPTLEVVDAEPESVEVAPE